jgi:hypothetical protein
MQWPLTSSMTGNGIYEENSRGKEEKGMSLLKLFERISRELVRFFLPFTSECLITTSPFICLFAACIVCKSLKL